MNERLTHAAAALVSASLRALTFATLGLGLSLCPGTTQGQCIDYGDYLHWVGGVDTPHAAQGVAVEGSYAYLADRTSLQVVDISDPAAPSIAAAVAIPFDAYAVVVAGNYAYVAAQASGLHVVNISDPLSPFITGTIDTPGTAYGVAVAGDYAYVADDYWGGLQVVDISNPASPSITSTVDTPGHAYGVAVAGSYAYVADRFAGLQVVDISNPASPSITGTVDTPGDAWNVAVVGSYAYVADYGAGLQVVDIADPASPSITGSADIPGNARSVAVSGDYAYVTDWSSGLYVVDISNPASPSITGTNDTPGSAMCVVVSGSYAYVADRTSGFQVVDISNSTSTDITGTVDTPGDAWIVAVQGNYAYLADAASGLQVVDISDPASPSITGTIDTPGEAYCVAVAGNHAYVADYTAGLQVVDISNPASPSITGTVDTPDAAYSVAVAGSYAYVADEDQGLQVVDISNPASPFITGSVDTPGDAYGVAVAGNYAYVADYYLGGLQVADISDPASPSIAGTIDTPGRAYAVAVAGSYAYVADEDQGLQVVDISNPALPSIVGAVDTPGSAWGVTLSGSYAYVANDHSLYVVDISNPASPSITGEVNTPGLANGVAVAGSYAYIADFDSGLQIIPAQCADNTPTGSDVTVTPTDPGSGTSPVTMTFENVTEPGETTLSLESSGPGAPSGFRIGNPPTYYSIETTASYTGSIEICIDYSTISFNHESKLKLFHYVDGAWVDATVSLDPDADVICASVTSLSTFAAFTAADFVEAVPDGDCLSIANTCETVPVIFDRTDVTEARGISVTFTLSPELELCADPATSIVQGSWLDGFPSQTAFHVVSNGGGSYTVDQAILGESPVPCGEASGGQLFTLDLQAAAGDGTGTITVTDVIVRDCANAPIPGIPGSPASITIDTAAPVAVADLTAAQVKTGNDTDGTTEIALTFGAPGDATVVEVYRAPYHLGGVNAHPEYDDVVGAGPPATPSYPPAAPWALTAVNTTGQSDETTERGYWYFVMFTKDACGNISAVSNLAGGTLNYHLGDVVPDPGATRGNNLVDGLDISRLGDNYGLTLGAPPDALDYLDVGPTADFSVNTLPTTDNQIQFEDLMMFAINFEQVSAPQAPPEEEILELPFVALEITEVGDLIEARLLLHANDALVKGIHTRIAATGLELLGVAEGSLVSSQADPVFFKDLETPDGVWVDLAVMGMGKTLTGEGELAVLTFRVLEPGATPELVDADLRGRANRRLGSGTQSVDTPTVAVTELSLLGAYPNPFTNSTDIVFRIPDRRQVSVAIFDVTGRLVRRLGGHPLEAGEHRLAWDGRDSTGSRVGAGIYFYRFDAGSLRETRKLVLTR